MTPGSSRRPTGKVPPRGMMSPRRRRLRWTLVTLGLLAVGGVLMGLILSRRHEPKPYRPGEQVEGITRSLDRDLPPDAPEPRFSNVTEAAGLGAFRTFVGERTSQLPEDMGPGAAWGDFDNDGWDDLFLVSVGGALDVSDERLAPCALYRNRGDGTFERVAGFPELRIRGMAAAWGDYDADGFLDLAVSGYNALHLFHNDGGTGRFTRDARFANRPGFWSGLAWGDYDNDRWLDLYVCQYVQYAGNEADRTRTSLQVGTAVPYTLNPSSFPAGVNLLFHNRGDGTFEEVAESLGVTNPQGRSLGALWHDFDQDGWLDLYVANDVSDNVFFYNRRGRFEDLSHPAYIADYRSAMGMAVGDIDRDGDDDLFITHWVAQENALYLSLLSDLATKETAAGTPPTASLQPGASAGNKGTNTPPPAPVRFIDMADMKGLGQTALQRVGWGCAFVDFDADGWLDLVVANGNTIEEPGPFPRKLKAQPPFLFWNRRGEFFYDLAPLHRDLAEPHVSRGLAVADFDNDGDQDFLIMHLGQSAQLFRNDMQAGHWLKIRLQSLDAYGRPRGFGENSCVRAYAEGKMLQRWVVGASYLSQHSRTLHFGLGEATRVDRVEIRWHAGGTQSFGPLDADTTWEFIEGQAAPRRWSAPARFSSKAPASHGAAPSTYASPSDASADAKQRLIRFWKKQRAAMDAMKTQGDYQRAIELFCEALALNPNHEDARYYLAHCLAERGQPQEALTQLAELQRINPQSHRAFQQWGCLRARTARHRDDLEAARRALLRAHELNPEETGALQLLAEVELLLGHHPQARRRLEAVLQANPHATGALFLQGYLDWKKGAAAAARDRLTAARTSLGPDWKPQGATAEGDVRRRMHRDPGPLSRFWESWNGEPDPATAYAALDRFLQQQP